MASSGSGPPLYPESFRVSLKSGAATMAKVFDVGPEEVAKAHEGSNCFDIFRDFGHLNGLQLIFSGLDSFRRQSESEVGNLLVAKDAFFQINL